MLPQNIPLKNNPIQNTIYTEKEKIKQTDKERLVLLSQYYKERCLKINKEKKKHFCCYHNTIKKDIGNEAKGERYARTAINT